MAKRKTKKTARKSTAKKKTARRSRKSTARR